MYPNKHRIKPAFSPAVTISSPQQHLSDYLHSRDIDQLKPRPLTTSSFRSINPNQDASVIRIQRKWIQRKQLWYQQPGNFPFQPAVRQLADIFGRATITAAETIPLPLEAAKPTITPITTPTTTVSRKSQSLSRTMYQRFPKRQEAETEDRKLLLQQLEWFHLSQ